MTYCEPTYVGVDPAMGFSVRAWLVRALVGTPLKRHVYQGKHAVGHAKPRSRRPWIERHPRPVAVSLVITLSIVGWLSPLWIGV